jgi:membrane protein
MRRPNLSKAARIARTLMERALREFVSDSCPQRAAAISYYALLSLFPLVILAVGAFGLALDSDAAREQVIDFVLDRVPLRPDAGRRDLRELLASVTDDSTGFGLVGAGGLLFAASGVMGAIRHGLNAAWDVRDPRPPLQGKLIDVVLVLGFGLIATVSLGLSLAVRLSASLADNVGDALGTGVPITLVAWAGNLVPVALSLVIFTLLFRVVPASAPRLRDTWPGVLVAVAGFEAAKAGFSLYLHNFSRYDVIYASLGSVIAFIVFVWVAANVLLLGAEVASEFAEARDHPPAPDPDAPPLRRRVAGGLRRLIIRREN